MSLPNGTRMAMNRDPDSDTAHLVLPRRSRAAALALLAATATVACGRAPESSGFTERDSAGVSIRVSTDSVWMTGEGWSLSAAPLLRIGSEAEPLFEVEAATFLPDGGVALANDGTHEVLVFDPSGRRRFAFGGEGDGPGEFRSLETLWRGPGDTLVAFDRGLNRATLISLDGTPGRMIPLPRFNGAPLDQLMPLMDGRFVGTSNDRGRVPNTLEAMGHVRD
jgi:hypothetical protein